MSTRSIQKPTPNKPQVGPESNHFPSIKSQLSKPICSSYPLAPPALRLWWISQTGNRPDIASDSLWFAPYIPTHIWTHAHDMQSHVSGSFPGHSDRSTPSTPPRSPIGRLALTPTNRAPPIAPRLATYIIILALTRHGAGPIAISARLIYSLIKTTSEFRVW